MLKLVTDLRNHPASDFLRFGIPITLSPDDPNVYGYIGVTPDYYEAYVAWNLNLKQLKQISLNSLVFSQLSGQEKISSIAAWYKEWNQWIHWVLNNF